MIYLDYNATTPHDPEVLEAMREFAEREFGNPSSGHFAGRRPKEAVESARAEVASLIGAQPQEVFFTSGGTESNNFAILGSARELSGRGNHIVISNVEHPAVSGPCNALESEGFRVTRVPVDEEGILRLDALEEAIDEETILVSVMHANNEIGTIQPVKEISRIARRYGARVHTDAAQSLGKIPVNVDELDVDMLTVAGHKLYAPKGIGAIYLRGGIRPAPIMYGGGQEHGVRPGTENVIEIAGLGAAARVAERDLAANSRTMCETRDRLHQRLSEHLPVTLNGHVEKRLPNTLNVALSGATAQELLGELRDSLAASAGSACHADEVSRSPVLAALGVDDERGRGTVRFSTGKFTTLDDVDEAARLVAETARRQREAVGR